MKPRPMPAELLNEIFASLPLEKAFGILAKMPNWLLARNVRKILKSIEMAMNKWNEADCGPKLVISEGGLFVKHNGPFEYNCIRAVSPIPSFNLNAENPSIAGYFEVQILYKDPLFCYSIDIGICTKEFPLGKRKRLGEEENSIGIYAKNGIRIDGRYKEIGNTNGCFEVGNVIGLGIIHFPANFPTMKCFATLNGQLLGKIELPAKFLNLNLFPAATLICTGDSIRANFGQRKWLFNPSQILH